MAVGDKHNNNKFYIKLLGEELIIVGQVSEEYIKQLADHINTIGKEISRTYPRLSRQRILGLTVMNVADEYYKIKDVYTQRLQDIKMLESENGNLKKKYNKLRKEYEELLQLLEEVDQ